MEEIRHSQFLDLKNRITNKSGYIIFTVIGILLILIGVLMMVFNVSSKHDFGWKYGPGEDSSIPGNLVILLGVILLAGVFIFFLIDPQRKANK